MGSTLNVMRTLMKPIFRTVSPTFWWIVAAVMGIPGLYDTVTGIARADVADIVRGATSCVVAVYFVYCALICKRDNGARLDQPTVIISGYVVMAIFVAGFLFKIAAIAQRT